MSLAFALFTATVVASLASGCDEDSSDDEGDDVVDGGEADDDDDDDDGEGDAADEDEGPSGSCNGNELSCAGDAIEYCEDGELVTASCDDLCGEMGFTSSGCSPDQGCSCDGVVDQECGTGTSAMCTCFEWAGGEACTDDAWLYMYDSCWNGSDETPRCIEDYVVDGTIDCDAAYACIG